MYSEESEKAIFLRLLLYTLSLELKLSQRYLINDWTFYFINFHLIDACYNPLIGASLWQGHGLEV